MPATPGIAGEIPPTNEPSAANGVVTYPQSDETMIINAGNAKEPRYAPANAAELPSPLRMCAAFAYEMKAKEVILSINAPCKLITPNFELEIEAGDLLIARFESWKQPHDLIFVEKIK